MEEATPPTELHQFAVQLVGLLSDDLGNEERGAIDSIVLDFKDTLLCAELMFKHLKNTLTLLTKESVHSISYEGFNSRWKQFKEDLLKYRTSLKNVEKALNSYCDKLRTLEKNSEQETKKDMVFQKARNRVLQFGLPATVVGAVVFVASASTIPAIAAMPVMTSVAQATGLTSAIAGFGAVGAGTTMSCLSAMEMIHLHNKEDIPTREVSTKHIQQILDLSGGLENFLKEIENEFDYSACMVDIRNGAFSEREDLELQLRGIANKLLPKVEGYIKQFMAAQEFLREKVRRHRESGSEVEDKSKKRGRDMEDDKNENPPKRPRGENGTTSWFSRVFNK
eukprot:TRINITY_DN295_c0_g1_i1.p1 TRINITY_DN295_c0_g1~~TRINITY_DN295_c0_g1_i1.p1  ORF type:complete len:337 (+),score=76.75 TRINITY_DN295_c0_g1_i1:103-1113(+)